MFMKPPATYSKNDEIQELLSFAVVAGALRFDHR